MGWAEKKIIYLFVLPYYVHMLSFGTTTALKCKILWFSAERWDEKPYLPTASTLWEVIPPAVRVCVAHPSSQATSRLLVSQAHPGEDFLPKTWCFWGTFSIKQWLARGWVKHLPEIQTAASCAEMFPAGTAPTSGFFLLHGHVQFKSCSGYSFWIEKQVMQILLAQKSCYLTEVHGFHRV